MKKQFDFLRKGRLAVYLVNCGSFLTSIFSKKITRTKLLLPVLLILGINPVVGQSVQILGSPPSGTCEEERLSVIARIRTVNNTNEYEPLLWSTTNNSGIFEDPTDNSTFYRPNPLIGASRNDTIIATMDKGYPVVWHSLTGIDTVGGTFKSLVNGNGNAGGRSDPDYVLPANTDGWVETEITNTNSIQGILGFSEVNMDNTSESVEYGIQFSSNPSTVGFEAFVSEGGSFPASPVSYTQDDIFRIERVGDTIVYKKNRAIFYKSTILHSASLLVDASIATLGDEFTNVEVNFGDDDFVFLADSFVVEVIEGIDFELTALSDLCVGDTTTIQIATLIGAPVDPNGWSVNIGTIDPNTLLYTAPTSISGASQVVTITGETTDAPNGVCPAVMATVSFTLSEAADINPTMVADMAVCESQSVTLSAQPTGNADTIFWTSPTGIFDPVNGITNSSSLTGPDVIDYYPSGALTTATRTDFIYLETDTDSPACPVRRDTIEITVHQADEVNNTFSNIMICEGDSIELDAVLGKAATSLQWTILDGTGSFYPNDTDEKSIYIPTGTVNASRNDTLLVTTIPTNSLCNPAVDTVVVTVIETAAITIVTAPFILCEEDTASVKASIVSGAAGVTWSIYKGPVSGTITTLDSVSARYMPADITSRTQAVRMDTLMAISYGLPTCAPDTAFLGVEVRNAPKLSPVTDKVICDGIGVRLATTQTGPAEIKNWEVIPAANGAFSSFISDTLNVLYTPTALATNATTARVDKIRFFTHDTSAVCPAYIDSLTVTINPEHTVSITVTGGLPVTGTGPDTLEICEGGILSNRLRGFRGGSTTSMEWTAANGTFSVPSSTAANFFTSYTPNTGQTSDVRIDKLYLKSTNVVTGCTAAKELVIVKVYKATALSAAPDTVACEAGTVTLSAISTGFGDDVSWNVLHSAGQFGNALETEMTTTAQNTVVYHPDPIVDNQTQFRIDTIVYSSVDHRNGNNTIICPVVTDTIFVSVYNAPTIEVDDPSNAKDTAYICEGIGLALDGSYGGGAIGATWSVIQNQGVFSNIVNDTLAIYTPNQGVTNTQRVDTLILTSNILTGTCNSLSVTDTLFVIVQEGPFVNAVEDSLTMCEGDVIDIEGTFGSVATGFSWSTKVAGSGTITSQTATTAEYTPTGTINSPGRLDVIYLTSNNGNATCLQAIDSIEIYVSAKPTLELGPDVSMCGALTQVLTPQSNGINNQLTWTSTDGTFANNPSPTGLYQPDFTVPIVSRPDGIIVTSIDSLGLCTAVKDTMLVTVYGLARIAIGAAGTICEDDTITLNPEFAGTLNDFTYTVSNNDGTIGVNNNQLFYIPNENTTQSSRVDQIVVDLGDVDGTGACPSLMDTIEVTVLNTPRSILVGDTTICAGAQVNLLTETFGLIDTFSSTYSTSLINYPSTPPTLIGGELKDTIIYGTRLINAACPADLTQIVVTIKEAGTIALNLPDTTICEANSLSFDAGLSNPNSYDYQWQIIGNTGAFDASNIATPTYTPNTGLTTLTRLDTIILTAVDTNNICHIGIDTIVVTVASSATLEDLRDTTICEGEALNLSAMVNGAATFFWASNSGTFSDSTQQQTIYTHAPVNGGNGVDLLTANISFANNTCTNIQKTMSVTVVGQLLVDAGEDTVICTGSTLQLAGTLGIGIDSAEWLVINNAGTFDDSKSLNAVYTPSLNTGTTDRVDVLILNTSASLNCAVPIDTILVTVKPIPTVDIGTDQMHMGTPDLILTAITSEIVEIGQWNGANGVFSNSTVNQTVYAPNDLGEGETRLDTIIYTADFGLAGCQTISDTLVINFEAPPAIGRGTDNAFCQSLCLVDTAGANIDRITSNIVVLANNLDQFDTCQVRPELDLKFWYPELGIPEPLNVMDFPGLPDSIVYDCNDRGTKNINVYVASDSMNIQLCPAVVKVDDSFLTCGERVVSGRITTFKGEPVEGFQVFVENVGTVGGVVPDPVLTDANGRYEFTLVANREYRIVPRNNEDLAKGVTAFDNVVISRHILGLEIFESPFQTIAADVNKSGSVTAFDIVLIRKVVLAREDEFQNNTSWRFIDAHYEFTDIITAAAAPFMETFLIAENMGNISNMDFIAVKVGDANGTVSPNDLLQTESRNGAAITFQTTNLPIEKDKMYEIPFRLLNTANVAGYQFTLAFEGLELMEVKEGVASAEHFGLTMQNRGLLMSSWSTANPIATDKTWFTLSFKANKSGVLREMLTLNSSVTPIEGITADQEQVGVQLNFVQPVNGEFDLFQNNPNPFKNSTTIGFTLPEASTAQLTILDVQGKEIQVINGGYEAGYNAVTLDLGNLPKGVFYYRLETAFGTKVQKMMHLE